jgi:branched-chain amino acid transport system substrate-binding protein
MGHFDGGVNDTFLRGVEMAVKDAREEYAPLGFEIEYAYYDDKNDYSEGMLIVDKLIDDKSLTAALGPQNLSILEMAAHRFENAGKLMIAPHGIADYVLDENNYKLIFSTAISSYDMGAAAKMYAQTADVKRWAVCYNDDDYSRREAWGFSRHNADAGTEVWDYVKTPINKQDFDAVYKRWEALGIEGVFIAPDDMDGIELLKLIKEKKPDMAVAGDYYFDMNYEIMYAYEEYLSGLAMVNAFTTYITDEKQERFNSFKDGYKQEYGENFDTWAGYGYDCVRMITDTAAKAESADPARIAEALRDNGYSGLIFDYAFTENGELKPGIYSAYIPSDGSIGDIVYFTDSE